MTPFQIKVAEKMASFMAALVSPTYRLIRLEELRERRKFLLSELSVVDSEINALSSMKSRD